MKLALLLAIQEGEHAASAGPTPGSNSISALGKSFLNSASGADGSRYRLRQLPIMPGPPRLITAA